MCERAHCVSTGFEHELGIGRYGSSGSDEQGAGKNEAQ